MYTFHPVKKYQYKDFNDFIFRSSYGNFRQTTYWGEIKSFSGWHVRYFALKKNEIIVGVATIFIRKLPYLPLSLMYCCRGPVVDWSDREVSFHLLKGLSSVVKLNRGVCLRIDPEASERPDNQEDILKKNNFSKLDVRVTKWNRSLYSTRVILDKDEELLFAQMGRKHRQNIRKTIRSGVEISTESLPEDKNIFFELMCGLELRRDSLIHQKNYYDKIFENTVVNNIGYFIKAIYEGKVISGLIVVVMQDKAWALYIANDYEYRKLMPNKLLMWESIKLAKSMGCEFIDLGSTQGTEDFDPKNDSLDMLKSAYSPSVVRFPGYYDRAGKFYSIFRLVEDKFLPRLIFFYYRINRIINLFLKK